MNQIKWCFLLCIFLVLNMFVSDATANPKVVKVKGVVKVLEIGDEWQSLKEGATVVTGAKLKTAVKSEAYIVWPDGHTVKVAPLSLVTVNRAVDEKSETNEIDIANGKIFASVSKLKTNTSFNVKTPTAVAGVRGTKFSVESKGGEAAATMAKPLGKVEVKKRGEVNWTAGSEGARLGAGDTIRTGADGSCVVAWAQGNVVVISPLTQITIDQLSSSINKDSASRLNLATGKATVKAKKLEGSGSFEVKTPTAVAGVRGTKFDVSVEGGDPAKTEAMAGKLLDASGKVEILRAGSDGWVAATNEMKTKSGDVIRTGADGSCVIAWGGGNVVRVSSLSKVKIDGLTSYSATGDSQSSLSLSAGKVFAKAKKLDGENSSFQIKTPAAIAGVRGTKFSVGLEGADVKKSGAVTVLAAVEGDVQALKAGESEWRAAAEGLSLREGDAIKTGAGGSCILAWNKGNVAKISQLSKLKIDVLEKDPRSDVENSTLDLKSGKIHFQAKKLNDDKSTFFIKTPTAIAGVRGTQCALSSSENGASAISCLDGKLSVISTGGGNEVVLGPKQKTSVPEGGQPAQPESMTPGEITEFQSVSQELSDPAYQNIEGPKEGGADSAKTEVKCVEGQLSVTAETGEEAIVNEGEKTTVADGEAPSEPAEMSVDEKETFDTESKLDNPAFESVGAGESLKSGLGKTTVRVSEGQLAVTTAVGEPVLVAEGEKTSVSEGAPAAEPVEMSADEVGEINSVEELDDPEILEMGSAVGEAGEESATNIQVVEGEVSVASISGIEIALEAGMKTDVAEGQAPSPPVEMSSQELNSFQQETQSLETIQTESIEETGSSSGNAEGEPSGEDATASESGIEVMPDVDVSSLMDTMIETTMDNVLQQDVLEESAAAVEEDLGTIHTTITVEQ